MKKLVICLMAMMGVLTVSAQKLNDPILGGELSNSAATSLEDIDEVMPRMKALGLNTVLIPAYWELMEPVEGKFDFTLIDRTIDVARREQLHVVFLWFGVWKNSMSCYTPGWFKQDTKRFPRAMTADGKQMEIASCFSDNVLQADLKAFSALMRHIREKDPQREVVIDFKTPTEKQQEEKKQLGEDGFAEAGGSVDQKANKRFSGKRLGLLSVDEVEIEANGTMKYLRRHNGDQTHQGRHARIGVGEWKLLHIKLYEY